MRKILLGLFFLIFCFSAHAEDKKLTVTLFHSSHCHACMFVRSEILPPLKERYKDKVVWNELETDSSADNLTLLFSVTSRLTNQKETPIVPTIVIGNKILRGKDEISKKLYSTIEDALAKPQGLLAFGNRDLVEVFKEISPLMVVGLGLVDGINPCAFAVIVFLVSFLAVYGYSRREVICVGAAYCTAVFLTYFALGLGLFKFFYKLTSVYFLITAFYLLVAGMCFLLAIFAIYDYIRYKRTKESQGMLLQLPDIFKRKINLVIGSNLRERKDRSAISLITSAFFIGILVSLLEAVCTGQVYLPTIVLILKDSSMRLKAFSYIFLYNLMFILPLLAVFAVSVLGVSSQKLNKLLKDNLAGIKLLMFGMFFLLGVIFVTEIDPAILIKGINGGWGNNNRPAAGNVNKNTELSHAKYLGLDLGDVPLGQLYEGVVEFPFSIKNISTSCDCLKAVPVQLSLEKKPSWGIKFYFNPKGYYGLVEQEIIVFGVAGQRAVLKLKGNVIGDKAVVPAKH